MLQLWKLLYYCSLGRHIWLQICIPGGKTMLSGVMEIREVVLTTIEARLLRVFRGMPAEARTLMMRVAESYEVEGELSDLFG